MEKKNELCEIYGIDLVELDIRIASLQSITQEQDSKKFNIHLCFFFAFILYLRLLDYLINADLDISKAVQLYFDESFQPKNKNEEKTNANESSLWQQLQRKVNLKPSTKSAAKYTEPHYTPLNHHTTFHSLLTNKKIMRGPAGHFSAKHDGPWNKFFIQAIESHSKIITIKVLMNECNEYLCIRYNKSLGITLNAQNRFAHWQIIDINSSQNIIALTPVSFPHFALCIDASNDYKPSLNEFDDVHKNAMYQFIYKHVKKNKISSFIQNYVANKMAFEYIQKYASSINKYSEYGLPTINGRCLTKNEKLHFIKHGYVVIRNAIDQKLCNEAIGWINNGMGNGSHINMRDINGAWICKAQKIQNLYFRSNVYSLVRSLLHSNPQSNQNYDCLVGGAQIALNFPLSDHLRKHWKKEQSIKANGWHIDGMDIKNDSTQIGNFSVLIGCILSNWNDEFVGNFTVWNKSHCDLKNMIQRFGEYEFSQREGVNEKRSDLKNEIIQIQGNVGDIILCHPFLAHSRGPNFSNNIRYAVFFRPYVMNHAMFYAKFLEQDMFEPYQGLKALIDAHDNDNDDEDGVKSIFE